MGAPGVGYNEYPAIKTEFDVLASSMDSARLNLKDVKQQLELASAVRAEVAPVADNIDESLDSLLKMKQETEMSLYRLNQRIEETVENTAELQTKDPSSAGPPLSPLPVRAPSTTDKLLARINAGAKKAEEQRLAQEEQARLNVARAKMMQQRVAPKSAAAGPTEALPTLDPNSPYRVVAVVKNFMPTTPGGPIVTSVQPLLVAKDD